MVLTVGHVWVEQVLGAIVLVRVPVLASVSRVRMKHGDSGYTGRGHQWSVGIVFWGDGEEQRGILGKQVSELETHWFDTRSRGGVTFFFASEQTTWPAPRHKCTQENALLLAHKCYAMAVTSLTKFPKGPVWNIWRFLRWPCWLQGSRTKPNSSCRNS